MVFLFLKEEILPNQTKLFQDDRYRSDIPEQAVLKVIAAHENGAPAVGEYFLQGNLVGRRHWDPDGFLMLETPYQDDRKHGNEYSWYGPGVLTLAEPYEAGLVHGTARQWDDDGTLLGTYTFVRGTGIDLWRARREDGTILLSEVFYLDRGMLHGFEWWLKDDQVSIYEERHWHAGTRHGIERKWTLNGRLYPGFPRFFVDGGQVSAQAYQFAVAKDPALPLYRDVDNRPERCFPKEVVLALG